MQFHGMYLLSAFFHSESLFSDPPMLLHASIIHFLLLSRILLYGYNLNFKKIYSTANGFGVVSSLDYYK